MRILLISDHGDPLAEIGSKESGGQNIFVLYLARYLSKRGVHVDIYTRWDKRNKKEVVNITSLVRVIRIKSGPRHYVPRDTLFKHIDEFAANVIKKIEAENIKYDVIHANYWFSGLIGLEIAKKIKIKTIFTFHSIGKIRYQVLRKFKEQKINNFLFKKRMECEQKIVDNYDAVISTSPVEKAIIKRVFRANGGKVEVIPIGVDTNIFKRVNRLKARKKLGWKEQNKILLYVGRIEWRKGIGTLFYALKELVQNMPDLTLYIVGGAKSKSAKSLESAERERLEKIAEDLGIGDRVFFLGSKTHKILYQYYSAADLSVVPSYYEPFGIIPLESMSCGTPVVASRTGGLKYTVVNGETGYLSRPRDYIDLARQIKKALAMGPEHFRDKCLKRIEDNFSWEKIIDQYVNFFVKFI
jgi:glycosyltransferase involved in cell wall biosynthesis